MQDLQQPQPRDNPEVLARFHAELGFAEDVTRQVMRRLGTPIEHDDLLSAAREGLLEAARRYDPNRNVAFRAYANQRVRGAIMDCVRRIAPLSRRAYERLGAMEAASTLLGQASNSAVPSNGSGTGAATPERRLKQRLAELATAAAAGMLRHTGDAHLAELPDEAANPEEDLARAQLRERIRIAVGELPRDEADVIRGYYFESLTLEQLAEKLGISVSWASRVHARAVARLTKALRGST
jgi:RNA polymerase sigma factor for flagellar operon FliA